MPSKSSNLFKLNISVYQLVGGDSKDIAELAKHFYVWLSAPLLPICVTAFNNAERQRNLLLRHTALRSRAFQIGAKCFIHDNIIMRGRQNVLAVDKLSIKIELQILFIDSNIYLGSGDMCA